VHGERLINEMRGAFRAFDEARPVDDRLPEPEGVYLEVDLRKGANPE